MVERIYIYIRNQGSGDRGSGLEERLMKCGSSAIVRIAYRAQYESVPGRLNIQSFQLCSVTTSCVLLVSVVESLVVERTTED